MKRQLAWLLSLSLLLTCAAGCKSDPTPPDSSIAATESSGEASGTRDSASTVDTLTSDTENSGAASASDDIPVSGNGNTTSIKTKASTKGNTTTTRSSGSKDTAVRNLKGRVINQVAYWTEPKKGESPSANAYWKLKESVQAKYNCTINWIFKSRESIDAEVFPSIMSGKPIADIFTVQQDRMFALISKKMVYALSDLKQFDFTENKWDPVVKQISTVNGKTYGMSASDGPFAVSMLLYNKDYFKKNNLTDLYSLQKSGGLDWEAFRTIAKNATKGDVKGFAMIADEYMAQSLIMANGGLLVSRGKGLDFTCTANSPNVLYALDFWQKMRTVDKSCIDSNGYTYGRDLFIQGKAAMFYGELSMSKEITDKANFDIGMVLFPTGPSGKQPYLLEQSIASPWVMAVTTQAPEDVAMVFDALMQPSSISWQDTYYDMYYSDEVLASLKIYTDLVKKGKFTIDYAISVGGLYDTGLHGGLISVSKGEMTPAQAIETVQGQMNAAIKNFGK